jgi:large-conductance mechanosensitive channel
MRDSFERFKAHIVRGNVKNLAVTQIVNTVVSFPIIALMSCLLTVSSMNRFAARIPRNAVRSKLALCPEGCSEIAMDSNRRLDHTK